MPSMGIGFTGNVVVSEETGSFNITNEHLKGNRIIRANTASAMTVTVPSGLTGGEPVTIIGVGAGTVSVAASGTTVSSKDSALDLAAQYSAVTLIPIGTDAYILVGDLA